MPVRSGSVKVGLDQPTSDASIGNTTVKPGESKANITDAFRIAEEMYMRQQFETAIGVFMAVANASGSDIPREFATYRLMRSYIELGNIEEAKRWADISLRTAEWPETAYYMCKALRERGDNALAYYYFLLARRFSTAARVPLSRAVAFLAGDRVPDYQLEYEKSILWYHVGGLADRYTYQHGLAVCMRLLDLDIPHHMRYAIHNNLPYYTRHLLGHLTVLQEEQPHEASWRFSTPTFVGPNRTIIRVVNYYVHLDGTYHVSNDHQVKTKLLVAETGGWVTVTESPSFAAVASTETLHYPEAYVLGLEDTRFLVAEAAEEGRAIIYTLSSSREYSRSLEQVNQVLGILDTKSWTMRIVDIIKGPRMDRHEKNWVFVDGVHNIIYDWYPSIQIGAIDLNQSALNIHTTIASPHSFSEMRGSTNGILYREEWWFVTHSVVHRSGQLRQYNHRLVVLDRHLGFIARYTMPFTFERNADVEYCLGLHVTDMGLTFGYSVQDRSSRILRTRWEEIEQLFDPQTVLAKKDNIVAMT